MTPLVIANWKMHGSRALLEGFALGLTPLEGVELVCCPPAVWLGDAVRLLPEFITLGGQDAHTEPHGAFTGDISAVMLAELGCRYVIVGHSERRAAYQENDLTVGWKAAAVLKAGMTPVICVGELLDEREAGQAIATVGQSVANIMDSLKLEGQDGTDHPADPIVIAYEPVWAIGSGRVPTTTDVEEMHRCIRQTVMRLAPALAQRLRILYGGSVKPDNAGNFAALPEVDGFLVGGASLQAESFLAIARAAADRPPLQRAL